MRVPLTTRDFLDRAELVYPDRVGVDPAHLEPVLDLLDDDPRRPFREAGVADADVEAWRARLVDGREASGGARR